MGVDDEVEFFELLENSIDGGRTYLGSHLLNGEGYFVGGEVSRRVGEDVRDGSFGDSDALGGAVNGRENGLFVGSRVFHQVQTRAEGPGRRARGRVALP